MVLESVFACLLTLTLRSNSSAAMFSNVRLTTSPTHIVEVIAVGEWKRVQVEVENLYPHDIQITSLLEGSRTAEDDKYLNDNSVGSSLAEEQVAPIPFSPHPSTRKDKLAELESHELPQARHSISDKFTGPEREEEYGAFDVDSEKQKEHEGTTKGWHQKRRGYDNTALTSTNVTASCILCETQNEITTAPPNQAGKNNFFPYNTLPGKVRNVEGKSVCRLVLRMKPGARAEELKHLQKTSQEHHTRETNSSRWDTSTVVFKSGPASETHPSIGQRIGGFFSLDSEQARLVTALSFLEKLDLIILHLEGSTDSQETPAATALRKALTNSADVDFVEVDEVVYASETDRLQPSLHSPIAGKKSHENYRNISLKGKSVAMPATSEQSSAEPLLQFMTQNIHQAQAVAKRAGQKHFWDPRFTRTQGPIVAVIDSGVNYRHPALCKQMWVNKAEEGGVGGVDDDDNGYVDDIYGYNFFADSGDPMDVDGHGTHCAGIIAAQTDNVHVEPQAKTQVLFGVNPNARIMALKFMERNVGFLSDAARSLDYAIQHGARISSNSWGNASSLSRMLLQTVQRAAANNLLLITASGNARDGIQPEDLDKTPLFPAALRNDNVLTVAATDLYGSLAPFSNFGRTSVSLAAPGLKILSTWLQDTYKAEEGTSQACPLVAGVASLLYSMKPHTAYSEVKHVLISTAKRLPSLTGKVGYGLVDAQAAALTMERMMETWAMILDAPSNISRSGKKAIMLQLLGKTLGHYATTVKIIVIYEGLQLGSIELPVSLDVVDPFRYPVELQLGPVVQGLFSVPTGVTLETPPDTELTLRVAKLSTTNDDIFYGFPPVGSEYRKSKDESVKLMDARCRRLTPGKTKGVLTLSVQMAASFQQWQLRQQEDPDRLLSSTSPSVNITQVPALSTHAADSLPDPPSLPHALDVSSRLFLAEKLGNRFALQKLPGTLPSPTREGSSSLIPLAKKRPLTAQNGSREVLHLALSADTTTTASPPAQATTAVSTAHRPKPDSTEQQTVENPWEMHITAIPAGHRTVASLLGQVPPPIVSLEQPSTATQSQQPYVHVPAGQLPNRWSYVETAQETGPKSKEMMPPITPFAAGMRYPSTELYTIMFSCEAVDITVEPHDLSAVIDPGGLKVFVIRIKKAKSLIQTGVLFALEKLKLDKSPLGRADAVGRPFLELSTPVNIDVKATPPSAVRGYVEEEECAPFVGSSKKNQTYYYFSPTKEPPAALPRVKFFWNDIREEGQRVIFPTAYTSCAYRHVKLRFRFPFWDEAFESVYVSSHGMVHTVVPDSAGCLPHRQLSLYKGALAPLWTAHLYHMETIAVYFRTWKDRAIFQWEGVTISGRQDVPERLRVSFQLVLDVSGRLLFYYNDIPPKFYRMQTVAGIVSPDGLSSLICSLAIVRGNSAVLMYPASLFFEKVYTQQKIRVSEQQQKRYQHQRGKFSNKESDQLGHPHFAFTTSSPDAGRPNHFVPRFSHQSIRYNVNDSFATDENKNNNHTGACALDMEHCQQRLSKQESTSESREWTPLRQFSVPPLPTANIRAPPVHVKGVSDSYSSKGTTLRPQLLSDSYIAAANRHVSARPSFSFSFISALVNVPSSAANGTAATAARPVFDEDKDDTEILQILPHAGIIPPGTSTISMEVLAVPGLRHGGSQFSGSLLLTATYFDSKLQTLVRGSGLIAVNVTVSSRLFQRSGSLSI